jgi:hypothetical protein
MVKYAVEHFIVVIKTFLSKRNSYELCVHKFQQYPGAMQPSENFVLKLLNLIKRHDVQMDGLCGLVVRVLSYRSRGSGSIPSTTRFSEK